MSDFSRNLRELREARGMTQRELSERLGVAAGTIAMYETGKREPDFARSIELADIFRVDLDYLLGHTDKVHQLSGDDTDVSGVPVELTALERELIISWRHSSKDMQRMAAYALGLTQEDNRCEE